MKLKVFHAEGYGESSAAELIARRIHEFKRSEAKPLAALGFYDQQLVSEKDLDTIQNALGDIPFVGCSSDGEFSSELGFCEDSFVVGVFTGTNEDQVCALEVKNLSQKTPDEIRQSLLNQLDDSQIGLIDIAFCFSESLLGCSGDNISEVIRSALGPQTPLLGGMSADQWQFKETFQNLGSDLRSDSLVVLALSTEKQPQLVSGGGFSPIGIKLPVTKAENNRVFRIGDSSAIDFYEHYLGTRDGSFGEYPIQIIDSEQSYIRAPLSWDSEQGYIDFAGRVPQGAIVQITETSRSNLVSATNNAVSSLADDCESLVAVLCAARKHILGTKAQEEIELIRKNMSLDTPFLGFYSFGEYFSNELTRNNPAFLNESCTFVGF